MKPTDLIIIASATAKPGKEKALENALRDVAAPTRAQAGNVQFSLYRKAGSRQTIIGFERWASNEAHAKHLQGAHVQRLMAQMADILAEPPSIVAYDVLAEG